MKWSMDNYKIYCKIDNKEVEVKTFINYFSPAFFRIISKFINKILMK